MMQLNVFALRRLEVQREGKSGGEDEDARGQDQTGEDDLEAAQGTLRTRIITRRGWGPD